LVGDPGRQREMSAKGRLLVDGRGARRAVAGMRCALLDLRPIRAGDAKPLWGLANDPEVRSVSFTSDPIPSARHEEWLRQKLNDPNCLFQVAVERSGSLVGQIRLDLQDQDAVVSISLGKGFRARGWGAPLLLRACRTALRSGRASRIHAYVKEGNGPSEGMFREAGFEAQAPEIVHNQRATHWILSKES